ncbi:MAG: cbb3-type cytochrome c oxidase subunit II [Nitrospinota bacterium]
MAGVSMRWIAAFAGLSAVAAVFFLLSVWKDYSREWRDYQRTFREMLAARAATVDERREALKMGDRFEQILVAEGERVDRCVMCHRGIEHPAFSGAPQPFAKHPDIPRHPFEDFGCTVCHQGQGRATTAKDAHGEVAFWEEPLLRAPFIQASCGPCHAGPLKGAPLIQRGRQLYLTNACIGCHKIRGVGGAVGPDLTFAGERRKDPKWQIAHLKNPQKFSPGSTMPPFARLPQKDLEALAVYLLSLRRAPAALALAAPRGEKK